MFEKMSMARLTTFERNSFGRAMEGLSLSNMDKQNLVRVKNKMGLESLGTSITLYKHVMRGMMASSTHLLPDETVLDILKLMLNTIHACMSDYPREGIIGQYWGKPRSFWSALKTIVTNHLDYALIPDLMALGLIRAKNDNQDRFWHSIRDDALLSCLIINSRYFGNLVLFIRGMLAKPNVEARFHELIYDGNTPKYRHLALAKSFYREIDADSDLINDIYLKEGEPLILNEMALDMLTAGDTMEDYLDEAESEDELEERGWEGDKLRYTIFCREDMKKAMQETAMSDFSSITIMSPVEFVCFPWLGKGDYEMKNIRGMDFFVSSFPGEQDFPTQPKLKVVKVETREFKELAKMDPKELDELTKSKHIPKAIKDRDEAMRIFKEMGIFIPEIFTQLYPNQGNIQDWIEEMVSEFKRMGGFEEQAVWATKRERFRYHLPGFQGIVKDSRLKAEVEAIFGPNGHYLFSGNVKLTESTFKQLMRTIKRIFNRTDSEGRAKLLFIISTLLDTVPAKSSDAWYMDAVTEIIEELESALDEEDDIVMMPVPTKSQSILAYREKDPFE
jgi:molybdopterin converting factor small subunit